jgi:hypothetical protein
MEYPQWVVNTYHSWAAHSNAVLGWWMRDCVIFKISRDFTWHHPKLERNRTLSKRTNMNPNVFWPNPEFYG